VADLLNEARLADQAGAALPDLFDGIARGWIDALPGAAARIRSATPAELPATLHELRSGAVAVGLAALPAALAAAEQAAEAGHPPDPAGLDLLLVLAERSADALGSWWDAT